MRKSAGALEERKPQTIEERRAQLERIADKMLMRIEAGQCTASEREKLIRSYEAIDRILSRHNADIGAEDDPLLQVLKRWDNAAKETA